MLQLVVETHLVVLAGDRPFAARLGLYLELVLLTPVLTLLCTLNKDQSNNIKTGLYIYILSKSIHPGVILRI